MSRQFLSVYDREMEAARAGIFIGAAHLSPADVATLNARRQTPSDALTQVERMVVQNMGITAEQFVAARQARREKFLGASGPADDADEVRSKIYWSMGLTPDGKIDKRYW